jgi:hypothetical protein
VINVLHLRQRLLGVWTRDPESALRLDAQGFPVPGVYAFVVHDVVVYVGLTKSGLHTRFEQYRRGHKRQRTVRASDTPR